MKALVVYSSKTGNTKKLAEALYSAVQFEKKLISISDNPDPTEYDFVAVGFWLQEGQPDPATQGRSSICSRTLFWRENNAL